MISILLHADKSCQTNLAGSDVQSLEDKVSRLTEELDQTKKTLEGTQFTEEALQGHDEKVSFYTGLPSFLALLTIFKQVAGHVAHSGQNVLGQFEEMMVCLVRLRLNAPEQDLAYRFGVSQPTISRVWRKWLNGFFYRLNPLIQWATKEEVVKTMPMAFIENFGSKVRVILDCFEVYIDRPTSLVVRAATWSHYKHHNTVKFLIGICPQGSVTFLSKAYGGRASDKSITEHSGVLHLLEFGDVVLADRGFLISESVGLCCATLHIPPFTKGREQLCSIEVESTRELANVRIHVERVIGLVRNKYTILRGTLPNEMLRADADGSTPIDKIAVVCCALANLCSSVVPRD